MELKGQQLGYIRVSSFDQNTSRQLEGVYLDQRFEEKASAKDAGRPILQETLKYARKGDTLHVHSIDRLARNLADLQQLVKTLSAKGVTLRFHKEGLTFTGEDAPMQKLILHMMGAFAEFERSLIRERQREGIAAARARGKHLGRKAALTLDQVTQIRARAAAGESKVGLAKEYAVSRQTIYAALAEHV